MTEEQVGAGMYELGYRYRIRFSAESERMPLYVKTTDEAAALMRGIYKREKNYRVTRINSLGEDCCLSHRCMKKAQ